MSTPTPPKPKQFTHTTYIPDRRPQWKYHTGVGLMKNALTHSLREGWGYRVNDDVLEELYHLDPNAPGMKDKYGWGWNEAQLPWKNTQEEIAKRRQAEINELERQVKSLENQLKQKKEELFDRLRRED